jgi:hypothetical protein
MRSRQRLPALSHMPKVGDEVSFTFNSVEKKGNVTACFGRIYLICSENRYYARIYDETFGLKES